MSAEGDKLSGKAKELAGKATGNDRLEGEGQGQKMAGKIEGKATDVKKSVEGAVDKVVGHR